MEGIRPRPMIPEELPKLLHDISYAVIKNNPKDLIPFLADHFQKLCAERDENKEDINKNETHRTSNSSLDLESQRISNSSLPDLETQRISNSSPDLETQRISSSSLDLESERTHM